MGFLIIQRQMFLTFLGFTNGKSASTIVNTTHAHFSGTISTIVLFFRT
jgi:hypothetical protein